MKKSIIHGCMGLLALIGWTASATAGPVIPGYETLKESGKATDAELGEVLLSELNCAACHKPPGDRIGTRPAPDLTRAGARLTPQYLRAFLSDPAKTKQGTSMPTIFHASAPQAKAGAVEALTHFLVSQDGPIQPSKAGGSKAVAARGKALFESVGCVACHQPEAGSGGIPLNHMASKTTVDKLSAFLQNPHTVRPSGRMPNLKLKKNEAVAIAVYLLREQLENPQNKDAAPASKPGVSYKYYEGNYIDKEASLAKATPKAEGHINNFSLKAAKRKSKYALVFEGTLEAPKTGSYKFECRSDDSSFLWINDQKVVSNPGAHGEKTESGSINLTKGPHAIKVIFTQGGGGAALTVRWQPPGDKMQSIPTTALTSASGRPMVPLKSEKFTVDPRQVKTGAMMFAMMGCSSCHTQVKAGPAPPFVAARKGKTPPLASLNTAAETGCLSENVPKGRPNYDLDGDQKKAIRAALAAKADLAKPRTPDKQILHDLTTLGCLQCHQRDGIGGPDEKRNDYFKMAIQAEMGDEGRLPPTLSGIGAKLKPEALKGIVQAGRLHVRPYMSTRMPVFQVEATDALLDRL
ncbi:MAG: c-type cytochrome, partial [Phycisphaeraceae bacterium]|nr:c-type cytochrome [Phycisphaeraceae bacterium]